MKSDPLSPETLAAFARRVFFVAWTHGFNDGISDSLATSDDGRYSAEHAWDIAERVFKADVDQLVQAAQREARERAQTCQTLLEACYSIYSNEEDCDECNALSETGNDNPCIVHRSQKLYEAVLEAESVLGPCCCGHGRGDHHTEDTTKCRTCDCGAFRLPASPADDDRGART